MVKQAIRSLFSVFNVEFALRKNLWYMDAFAVQKRIITEARPVIFDVGASDGGVVAAYKRLYPGATIHAFEPQSESFEKLQTANAALKDVFYNNLALSDVEGSQAFYRTQQYASSSLLPPARSGSFIDDHTGLAETYEVKLETLDHYCAPRAIDKIDILKMDVQGNELNILKGSSAMLKKSAIRLIYSEVWFTKAYENQPFYEDIALYLREYGYQPFGLYNMHWDLKLNGKNLWADAIFVKKG